MKYTIITLCLSLALLTSCNESNTQTDVQSNTITSETTKEKAPAPPPKPEAKPQKVSASGGDIEWMSWEKAQEMNKKSPKRFFVDVYTPWCGPCKMLDRNTFNNPAVAEYINENFYAVKFNGESPEDVNFKGTVYKNPEFRENVAPNRRNTPHELTKSFRIRGYPSMLIFDQELNRIHDVVGYRNPDQLLQELKSIQS